VNKGTAASRRGRGDALTRSAFLRRHRQSAAVRAVSIYGRRRQREAGWAAASSRDISNGASTVEQPLTRVSTISPHESFPARPYRPRDQRRHDSGYANKDRYRRSYGASNGPKRTQGERRARSYGSRHGYHERERCARSYGSRRVYRYGYNRGRLHWQGRERQHIVQHGHDSSIIRFRRLYGASSLIELLSSSTGAIWVAGLFLNSFSRNLNFRNVPAILKLKYQLAGNEYKSLTQAQAVWKSIPAQVRAGGPEALWKFHQGKEWSHIIPRSQGGSSTADNAIWWGSKKNRSLGPNPMSLADIADAKAVIRSDAIRAAVTQTASGMVKGALVAVVVGGTMACLECGLDYAEGKITRREMVQKIVRTGVTEGGGAFVTTGIVVGISMLFPFLIPILTPALIVLQAVSLALMGAKGVRLAKGWWAVVERQEFLDHYAFGGAVEAVPNMVKTLPAAARRNIKPSGKSLIGKAQGLTIGKTTRSFPWKANRGTRANGLTGLRRHIDDNSRIEEPPTRPWHPDKSTAKYGLSKISSKLMGSKKDGP